MKKISGDFIRSIEQKTEASCASFQGTRVELLQSLLVSLSASPIDTPPAALEAFFVVLKIMELDISLQALKERDKQQLRETAERCLLFCQIQPVSSQHSWLYSKLHLKFAEHKLQGGAHWESFVHTMIADHMGRDGRDFVELTPLLRGIQSWRLGHIRIAQVTLAVYDHDTPANVEEHWQSQRLLLRIQRLSGDAVQTQARLHLLQSIFRHDAEKSMVLDYEEAVTHMRLTGDPKNLMLCLKRHKSRLEPLDIFLGQLWLFASKQREPWKDLTGTVRQKAKEKTEALYLLESQASRLVQFMEQLYNSDLAMLQKIERLGRHLKDMHELADPELALVFLAAVIRWLYRSRQNQFATVLTDEYRALSLRYSDGQTEDGLGLIQEIVQALPVVTSRADEMEDQQLYVGRTPRILKITRLLAKSAYLASKSRGQPLENVSEEFLHELETVMGELKGPIMKFGQRLAFHGRLTPTHREIMQKILSSAPALPFPVMQERLEKSLGQPIHDVFAEFNTKPIAVASIGEVFWARLKDGREVAVKVKYPGIEKIIRTDMFLMKLLTPFYRNYLDADELSRVLKEIEHRFLRECDYLREARQQTEMGRIFAHDLDFIIPEVFPELSSEDVLVSTYVAGPRMDEFIRSADQKSRNTIAARFLKFSVLSPMKHGIMHIDPHLGNFLVQGDRLVILDFGAVYHLPQHLMESYRRLEHGRVAGNLEGVYAEMVQLRHLDPKILSLAQFKEKIGPIMVMPLDQDRVRPYVLPGEMTFQDYLQVHGKEKAMALDDETFFPAMVWSHFPDIFSCLGAELNWHQLMRTVLAEIEIS
ncbi:MAG TPA: AarF/ABC1/UbiB kinase family protein [Oligoflexus sp.]|uniref:ABC1 kinase family protein n=1 Tax=Oligoflexus sp. TaxID=1971216 RepID=UPI002D42F430|nr:AarF/ABC1/UbiB kinase family protein [Oligoflexus sp.]HYX31535.1 AarF/ABC1/UbiB kinase family protein [Oligoflexus sp.]